MASEDKDYKQSALGQRVNELMDDGYDFGEAVKQAMSEGLKDGGSVGIEILFKNKMADGGRVGLFMGGDPLTGQALSIYNSMNSYGFTDQQIADALSAQGLYGSGSTPASDTPLTNTTKNIINQGGDGGNGTTHTGSEGPSAGGGGGASGNASGRTPANGLSSSINASATTRGGGGGGGGANASTQAGGTGGGGLGQRWTQSGGAGTALTGGGGGGAGVATGGAQRIGGAGGSGLVILSYPNDKSITLADGATSTAGEQTDGSRKYIEIQTSGTVSWT